MAIDWSTSQRPRVGRILRDCPVESGRCRNAARRILPVASETDTVAQIWELWPTEGCFVLAKNPAARGWYFHATVETVTHLVDALTGVEGTSYASYLEAHWLETDALEWRAIEPEESRQ
jgi:hypothetical protein